MDRLRRLDLSGNYLRSLEGMGFEYLTNLEVGLLSPQSSQASANVSANAAVLTRFSHSVLWFACVCSPSFATLRFSISPETGSATGVNWPVFCLGCGTYGSSGWRAIL